MALPRITIVGAGLSGLTLASCLKAKGIPTVILEKSSAAPRFNYGITLHRWAYQPLLKILQMDEFRFHKELAVDKDQGGQGTILGDMITSGDNVPPGSFRCHRGRLEMLLREGQDISWDQTIHDMETTSGEIVVRFQDGIALKSDILVAADGVHSQVRRMLAPQIEPNVLPYVVFNGRRTVSIDYYLTRIASHMQKSTIVHSRNGDIVFQVSINDITPTQAALSYTYSRPARRNDALHKPDRPLKGAEIISDDFYAELEKLEELESPFAEMFDSENVRQDRVLHWLMRSILSPLEEVRDLARQRVFLIGDAAHAMPILGGEGANLAIQDGCDLAEKVADGFYDLWGEQRHKVWKQAVEETEKKLTNMHVVTQALL